MRVLMMIVAVAGMMLAGCTQQVDTELQNMRQQIVANEDLYAAATLAFADAADQMAQQKFIYQQKSLAHDTDKWIERHLNPERTMVTATWDEMQKMVTERDAKQAVFVEAQNTWTMALANFRRMVADKQKLSASAYAREANAMKAKESATAAWDSLKKTLLGALPTAAVAIPLIAP